MIKEQLRLFLQCVVDTSGENGIPIALENCHDVAVEQRLVVRLLPPGDRGGPLTYRLTDVGHQALDEANQALGDRATRYVHQLQDFGGGTKPLICGWPFRVPLSRKTRKFEGTMVIEGTP